MRPPENVRSLIGAYLDGEEVLKKGSSLDFAFDSWDPVESLADFENPDLMFKLAPVTVKTEAYRRYARYNPIRDAYEVCIAYADGSIVPAGAVWIDTETQYETPEIENDPPRP